MTLPGDETSGGRRTAHRALDDPQYRGPVTSPGPHEASADLRTAIVLGGSGFIGTHLTRQLVRDGYRVTILDLRPPSVTDPAIRYQPADVRRSLLDLGLPDAPDLVVNAAAVHREPGHEEHEYYETNVDGARHVTDLCDALHATDLVFISSISVYGPTDATVDETTPPTPTTAYGRSKLQAEEVALRWAGAAAGRTLSIVRPAAIFGPGEHGNFTRLAAAMHRRRFVYPGRRDTIKGCGYVHDLVRAIPYMHGRNAVTTYNFAFPRPYALEEICDEFSAVGGLRPPRWVVPLPLMLAAGRVGDAVGPLGRATGLSGRRVAKLVTATDVRPRALVEASYPFEFDLRTALEHWLRQEPSGTFV